MRAWVAPEWLLDLMMKKDDGAGAATMAEEGGDQRSGLTHGTLQHQKPY